MEEIQQAYVQKKPPRPFSSKKGSQPIPQQSANIMRLLSAKGDQNDPLADENHGSNQTELAQQDNCDFLEEDGDQFMVTKIRDEHGQRQRKSLKPNLSREVLSQADTEKISAIEVEGHQFSKLRVNSVNQFPTEETPIGLPNRNQRPAGVTSHSNHLQEQSAQTAFVFPTSAEIGRVNSPPDYLQTQNDARISNFIGEQEDDIAVHNLNSEKTVQVRPERSSQPEQQKRAVLPLGARSETSQVTERTQLANQPKNPAFDQDDQPQPSPERQSPPSGSNTQHRRKSFISKAGSDGQRTILVPSDLKDSSQLRISQENDQLQLQPQTTADARTFAKLVTGQSDHENEERESQTNRQLLTDSCQPESPFPEKLLARQAQQVPDSSFDAQEVGGGGKPQQNLTTSEQVQSAEFAMSTFNVLNNQEIANAFSTDQDNSQVQMEAHSSLTEQRGESRAVQKQCILSGTRELKQSTSVLTGHASRSNEEPNLVSSTVMDDRVALTDTDAVVLTGKVPAQINVLPNQPTKKHLGAVDLANGPKLTEQVVFNRLPKNYFMADAEEQMDIDIAINDIKEMRQGFLSYVHDESRAEEDDIDDIDQILDPSKFLQRHFGEENPDIIFQEVITEVPDPVMVVAQQPEDAKLQEEVYDDQFGQDGYAADGTADWVVCDGQLDQELESPAGFTEQNVTPGVGNLVEDMWGVNQVPPTDEKNRQNFITGETFLKYTREVDTKLNDIASLTKKVDDLEKPFNDEDMEKKPNSGMLWQHWPSAEEGNDQPQITVALDQNDGVRSETHQESVTSKALNTNDQNQEYLAASEDGIIAGQEYTTAEGHLSQQTVFATNQQTLSKDDEPAKGSSTTSREINVTKRRKVRHFTEGGARRPVKVIRMADYFKPSPAATLSALNMSVATTADEKTSIRDMSQMQLSEFGTLAQEQKMREELDRKLEQDILDNVGVNFIFNKGKGLARGLIDQDRIFSVMNKLKELAYKQLENGSGSINYAEIVAYVKDTEGFFAEEIKNEERTKLYAGEAQLKMETIENASIDAEPIPQQVAKEPPVVGLGDNNDEKSRRWNQCVNFLRNNPKLLLQMIPNPSDDEDDRARVIPVGRPRPKPKQNSAKEGGVRTESGIQRAPRNKFMAMSQDTRSGPAQKRKTFGREVTRQAQKPIKIRTNVFNTKRPSQRNSIQEQEKREEVKLSHQQEQEQIFDDDYEIPEDETLSQEQMTTTLNIQTHVGEIQNPVNVQLPLSTPETTKFAQSRIFEGPLQSRGDLNSNRQQSAVTRTKTTRITQQKLQGVNAVNSVSDLRKKNSMFSKLSNNLRGFSGQVGKARPGNEAFNRIQFHSEVRNSIEMPPTETGSNYVPLLYNSTGMPSKIPSQALLSMHTGQQKNRNDAYQNDFYKTNKTGSFFKNSSKGMQFSGHDSFYRVRRPTTAVTGPTLTQAHGIGRRRLASTSIMRLSSITRASNRQFQYNKKTYQSNGTLHNVTSTLKEEIKQHQRNVQNRDTMRPNSPDSPMTIEQYGNVPAKHLLQSKAMSAMSSQPVPSIFRQSNEMSAMSVIGQDGQVFYFDSTGNQQHLGSMVTTAEVASQTGVDEKDGECLTGAKEAREIEVQTEIKDVTKAMTPPLTNAERSMQSHMGIALQSQVDWAYTPLCIAVLHKKTEFNEQMDKRVFVETEVNIVLQMVKGKFHEFSHLDKLAPYHTKAMETLKNLLQEQGLEELFGRFARQYVEVTIENTLKLLLRAKLVFSARALFIAIFEKVLHYQMVTADAKKLLDEKETYKLPQKELNELRLRCGRMYEAGEKVLYDIRQLRADRKGQYNQPFIFKKKDLVQQIKAEVAEVKQLLKVYRLKRRTDSDDSDRPARFGVVTDDEVSEREEVRDSNYVGTDLYWENRFYQVRPFKQPDSGDDDEKAEQDSVEMKDVVSEDIKDKEFVMA